MTPGPLTSFVFHPDTSATQLTHTPNTLGLCEKEHAR